MTRATMLALLATLAVPDPARAQAARHALESLDGLRMHNVKAEPATLAGKKGLRVTIADDARARLEQMTPQQQAGFEQLVVVDALGADFSSGTIELEVAGLPAPGAGEGARGFVGGAFRVQPDVRTYDAFYLRPTNGRAEDQERRNHATQYISHPDWTWSRMRQET